MKDSEFISPLACTTLIHEKFNKRSKNQEKLFMLDQIKITHALEDSLAKPIFWQRW